MLLEPLDPPGPLFGPLFDDALFWGAAGVVILTEVPSAYEIVVVVDPSGFVAVWVVAPVISDELSNDDRPPCCRSLPCVGPVISAW